MDGVSATQRLPGSPSELGACRTWRTGPGRKIAARHGCRLGGGSASRCADRLFDLIAARTARERAVGRPAVQRLPCPRGRSRPGRWWVGRVPRGCFGGPAPSLRSRWRRGSPAGPGGACGARSFASARSMRRKLKRDLWRSSRCEQGQHLMCGGYCSSPLPLWLTQKVARGSRSTA